MNPIEKRLLQMIDKGRLHHAFFMVGSGQTTHEEKMKTARFLASHVFCQGQHEMMEKASHRIEKKFHPDYYLLEKTDKEIKVDEIQDLIGWVYKAPVENKQKFAVIETAQRLNVNASNALLKTLEEPPAHATLILCAPSKDHLLQTLRSRMCVLQFAQSDSQKIDFEDAPSWFSRVQTMVQRQEFDEKEVMDLTQEMAKSRADLAFFFQWIESYLKEKIQSSQSNFDFNLYTSLFEKSLALENQIYKRYGNISLQLDTFFLQWRQNVY